MVTSIVSSLGGGSGLDTAKLVDDLANASRAPKANVLAKRLQAVQSKISSVAQARSDLESFAKSLTELVAGGSLQSQPTVSDSVALSATATPGARIGGLSSQIVIDQLARAQTVYSGNVADAAAAIGQGTMTLSVGGRDFAILVDAGHDSLNGLASAINGTASGVSASVITDAAGSRLVVRGQTGSASAFTLTSPDAALQTFAYGGGGTMALGQGAQDARITVDSVDYVRDSNTISDVIAGVTLSLKKAAPGSPVSIGSARPTEALRQALQDFVTVFNTLKKDMGAAREATGGDFALRMLDRQLGKLLSRDLNGDRSIRRLSDVGIATDRHGAISLDPARLEAALRDRPDDVEALFAPTRDATHTETTDPGIALVLRQISESATSEYGALEGLRKRLDRESEGISGSQQRMEQREGAYRARLERQFGTLDSRISRLKATQGYPNRAGMTGERSIMIPKANTGGDRDNAERSADRARFTQLQQLLRSRLGRDKELSRFARSVRFTETTDGLRVDLVDDADFSMFLVGTNVLTPEASRLLLLVANAIGGMPNDIRIRGHTDASQFAAGARNNWTLSGARADATRQHLMMSGIGSKRFLRIEGVADREPYKPTDPYDAVNRRISITLGWTRAAGV